MIILTTNRIQLIDNKVLHFCSMKLKNKYFDRAMPFITHCNDYGIIYVSLILSSIIFKYRTDVAAKLFIALALGFSLGAGLLKHLIVRYRPICKNPDYKLLVKTPKTSSFPSGHTTSSFAVFGVFWGLDSKLVYIFLGIAILIAFSRLYLYLHYPSDVVVGIILGLICGKLVFTLNNNMYVTHIVKGLISYINYLYTIAT
jgi:undecaprenyl-diphosphatase